MPFSLMMDRRCALAAAAAEALADRTPEGDRAFAFLDQLGTTRRTIAEFAAAELGWEPARAAGAPIVFRAILKGFQLSEAIAANYDRDSAPCPSVLADGLPDHHRIAIHNTIRAQTDPAKLPDYQQVRDRLQGAGLRDRLPALEEGIRQLAEFGHWQSLQVSGDEEMERGMGELGAKIMLIKRQSASPQQQEYTLAYALAAATWYATEHRVRNGLPANSAVPSLPSVEFLRRPPADWAAGPSRQGSRNVWSAIQFGGEEPADQWTRHTISFLTSMPTRSEGARRDSAFWDGINRTDPAADQFRNECFAEHWRSLMARHHTPAMSLRLRDEGIELDQSSELTAGVGRGAPVRR